MGRLTQRSIALFNRLLAYKQWRAAGCIEKLMTLLHEATREQNQQPRRKRTGYETATF